MDRGEPQDMTRFNQLLEGIFDDALEARVKRIITTKLRNIKGELPDEQQSIYDILLSHLGIHTALYPNNDIDLLQGLLGEDLGFQKLISKIKDLRKKLDLASDEPIGVIFPLLWPGNSLRRLFLMHNCRKTQQSKYGCWLTHNQERYYIEPLEQFLENNL